MKRGIFILILGLLIISSCSIDSNGNRFTENDIYEAGVSKPQGNYELSLENKFLINEYLGLPSNGNIMKVHSVCYDDELEQGYVVGIMSSYVGVIKDNEVIDYIDSNLNVGDYSLKYLYCGGGLVFVVTEDSAVKIDGTSREIIETLNPSEKIFPQNAFFDSELGILLLPLPDKNIVSVFDSNTLEEINEIPMSKSDFFTADENTIVAIENANNKELNIIWLDNKDFSEIKSESITGTSSIDSLYKSEDETLWVLENKQVIIYDLENLDKKPKVISGIVNEPTKIISSEDYIVVMSDQGYNSETVGFRGGVSVIDSEDMKLIENIELPYRHGSLDIDDKNNLLYVCNNDGGSVTLLDLETLDSEIIDVSNGVEGGIVISDGTVYIRNRLAGSTLYHFDTKKSKLIEEIKTGQWPVGIVYDETLDSVFTYDFLVGQISVVDTNKDEIVEQFETIAGASDILGDIVYDYTRHLLYVITPEKSEIDIVDGITGKTLKQIKLEVDLKDSGGGAGLVVVGIYEPTNLVYVYVKSKKTIYVYDGLNNFELIKRIAINEKNSKENYPYKLFVDNYHDLIYFGKNIIDAKTQNIIGEFNYGEMVVAVDNERGIIITTGEDNKEQEWLYVTNYSGELIYSIEMNRNQYVNARFAYDKVNGKIYGFYLVPAELWVYSI